MTVTPDVTVSERTARGRRVAAAACALGLLAMLPAGLRWRTSIQAHVIALREDAEETQQMRRELAPLAQAAGEATRAGRQSVVMLLPGRTAAQAAASLASEVSDYADEAGVTVASLGVRGDSARKTQLTPVGVLLSGTASVEALSDLLYFIETSERLLRVRRLRVMQANVTAPSSQPDALSIEVEVEGVMASSRSASGFVVAASAASRR